MIGVDLIGGIRRAYFEQRLPIKEIVRRLAVSRATVRRVIRGQKTEFKYERGVQPVPKLGEWVADLSELLEKEARLPRRERRSTQWLFEELHGRGYGGAHDSVHRFVKAWREERARVPAQAFVPMSFTPGEAYQFDWSHETITLQGLPLTIKAAHMKLSHSRMPFVRAYFRETQELVFDAHDKAFAFFGGVCRRGIYDNMKTAVEAIFVGKARQYNRRFLQMCSHHLIEPVACTPASGWEKGQVENQVGNLRDQLFRPKAAGEEPDGAECLAGGSVRRVRSPQPASGVQGTDDLGGIPGRTRQPDGTARTVRRLCREGGARHHHLPDHGRSQPLQCRRPGRRTHGFGAQPRGAHRRALQRRGRGRAPPPLPARPGDLRPLALSAGPDEEAWCFAQWRALQGLGPAGGLGPGRAKLKQHADGDRQFVKVLGAVPDHGLGAVEAACAEALAAGIASGDVILAVLARQRQPPAPPSITTPDALRLRIEPAADCGRYDSIRKVA
jgi:transposase